MKLEEAVGELSESDVQSFLDEIQEQLISVDTCFTVKDLRKRVDNALMFARSLVLALETVKKDIS